MIARTRKRHALRTSAAAELCRFHHRQVHEGRVVVRNLDDGALRFLRPDGRTFDSLAPAPTGPLSNWRQLRADPEQQGIHIDQHTAATR